MPSPIRSSIVLSWSALSSFAPSSRRMLLAAAILLVAAGGIGCGSGGDSEDTKACRAGSGGHGRGGRAAAERFKLSRTRLGMIRTDTRNGRVWIMPASGDGGWIERGTAPDLAGHQATEGRFEALILSGNRSANGWNLGSNAAVMVRFDHATGRTWLLETTDSETWTPARDSAAPPDVPTAPANSTTPSSSSSSSSSAPAGSDPTPAATVAPQGFGDTSSKPYPILTGDELGTTPEEKQEALETLHNALTKEGLPRKMRVWAVRQLGEIEPDLAVPELLVVLDDDDPVVVAEAVRQLSRTGRASTIPRILQLRDHPDAGVRAAVAETVIQIQ